MHYVSRLAAIGNVKKFFSRTPADTDSVSVQAVFLAWGRDLEKVEENKKWLSNKLTSLKYHNLISPIYALKNRRRSLDKLQLTLEGKRALGRIKDDSNGENRILLGTDDNDNQMSFTDVMRMVAKLRKENPDFQITFDVKLKGE